MRLSARKKAWANIVSTIIVGWGQSGVSGARQVENRQIPVTLATLPQSIPYARAQRDATPLADWATALFGIDWDRAGEKKRKAPTSLQQACNMLATSLQLAPYSGMAGVLPRCRSRATAAFLGPKGRTPAPTVLRHPSRCRQDTSRKQAGRALANALRGTARLSGTRSTGLPQMGDGLRLVGNGTRCRCPIPAAGLLPHGARTAR